MAEFPTSPVPKFPLTISQVWGTIITPFDSGAEQRRSKLDFPKFNVEMSFDPLSKSEVQLLWAFYQARKGSYEAFYLYTIPTTEDWVGMYVGVGDGATQIFDLPGKSTSAHAIYVDNVLQSSGYSILTGGGEASADRVSFTAAPAEGDVISCDFTGYMRIHCRFSEDSMSKEMFSYVLYKTSMTLTGVFP
jgi:hypothetical protein